MKAYLTLVLAVTASMAATFLAAALIFRVTVQLKGAYDEYRSQKRFRK